MQIYKVVIDEDKTKRWYLADRPNLLHREDGPAVLYSNRIKHWYKHGKRHREDGPAVEYYNGTKLWYIDGFIHREGGPAFERANGDKHWYQHGKLHRKDGPAIECTDGINEWYLNGEPYLPSKEKLDKTFPQENNLDGKTIVIDGRKYQLTEL